MRSDGDAELILSSQSINMLFLYCTICQRAKSIPTSPGSAKPHCLEIPMMLLNGGASKTL